MKSAPFCMERRVAWGECDPARIYYTPRVVDYALEAVETWFERDVGLSWVKLHQENGQDISPSSIECTYMRPMVAGQNVRLRLWPVRAAMNSIVFFVTGEDEEGTPCFQVDLTIGFVDRKGRTAVPIPAELRAAIESPRSITRPPPSSMDGGHSDAVRVGGPAEGTILSSETLAHPRADGSVPFTRQRRVSIGDGSFGGSIRPARIFDYVVESVGEWYEAVPGISWMELVCRREYGAPFVSAACDYLRPVSPGDLITLGVWVTRLGGASLTFAVTGFDERGEACFRTRLGACFIDRKKFKSIRIPDEFRSRIESYIQTCSSDRTSEEAC